MAWKMSDVGHLVDPNFGVDPYFERVVGLAECSDRHIKYMFKYVWPTISSSRQVIVGQKAIISYAHIGLFATGDRTLDIFGKGHILIEDYFGKGKTLFGQVPAILLGGKFTRFQGAVDNLPADFTGNRVREQNAAGRVYYRIVEGPAFGDIILLDEANRNTTRTQSAFLEPIAEAKATIFGETRPLKHPPWVILTQNPIETEGTFPFSEAFADRIMFKVRGEWFTAKTFAEIDERTASFDVLRRGLKQVCDFEMVDEIRDFFLREIYLDPDLRESCMGRFNEIMNNPHRFGYLLDLADEFGGSLIKSGMWGRGFTHWVGAAKTMAAFRYRDYVTPDDVLKVLFPILRHRVVFAPGVLDCFLDKWRKQDTNNDIKKGAWWRIKKNAKKGSPWKQMDRNDVIDIIIARLVKEAW